MDRYSLNARIYPVLILMLPIIVIGLSYSIEYKNYLQVLSSLGVTAALTYFLSNLGRDRGKLKEPKLWDKWGGMPSVQLLSSNNNQIDKYTKTKYINKLMILSPIENLSDIAVVDNEFKNEIYRSWTKYLIAKTRDTKKYPLVFKELISYGFRRNLWGLKGLSIALLTLIILGNYLYQATNLGFSNFLNYPIPFYMSELILFIILTVWIFWITENWIKIPAFAYAEKLLESIETL